MRKWAIGGLAALLSLVLLGRCCVRVDRRPVEGVVAARGWALHFVPCGKVTTPVWVHYLLVDADDGARVRVNVSASRRESAVLGERASEVQESLLFCWPWEAFK